MSEFIELKELPKDKLSYTQVSMYRRCSMQYYFRYVEGLKIPPKGSLISGKSVHKALEGDFSQKIESKVNLKTKDVCEIFSEEFETESKIVEQDTGEIDWGKEGYGKNVRKRLKGEMKDNSIKSLSNYHTLKAVNIQPVAVEYKFELVTPSFPIIGAIDLIQKLIEGEAIVDFKTTSKYTKQPMAPEQLVVYQMVKTDAKELRLDVMDISSKGQYIEEPFLPATEDKVMMYLDNIYKAANLIRTGIYMPNPGFNYMNCAMCGYKEKYCELWR